MQEPSVIPENRTIAPDGVTVAQPPSTSQPSPNENPLLERFLAQNDAACPSCGYNLRGSKGHSCPECGKGVELILRGASRFAGYGLFLLLALTWVFLASAMNTTRNAREVYLEALAASAPPVNWVRFSQATGNPVSVIAGPAPVSATPIPSLPPNASPSNPAPTSAPIQSQTLTVGPNGSMTVTRGSVVVTGGGSLTFSATPVAVPGVVMSNGPLWSAVSGSQWALLAWWGGLMLASIAGLVMLAIVHRRGRSLSPVGAKRAVALAVVLFALYAGYHIQSFTREIVGW